MSDPPLTTDTRNAGEVCAFYLRQAVVFYQERVDLGYSPLTARVQALSYLRRKTLWPVTISAGALDSELAYLSSRTREPAAPVSKGPLL